MSLDEAVAEFDIPLPDFIKMDVQGFEARVIRGGERAFSHAHFCMLELSLLSLYEGDSLITDVNQMMRGLGYRLVSMLNPVRGRTGEILQIDGVYRNDSSSPSDGDI